ncbi:hypothetical protein PQI23_02675 [Leucobacter sp. USCH14]|uniref:hypothetical protein n=1 Tax=Leucobacter sp. USCH14 TaxID=3024838 RepID=UPI0030AF53EB
MPYRAEHPNRAPSSDALRARIPGWGADLDAAQRPSWPMETTAPERTGAHWDFPERQHDHGRRERSIEHETLPPVFGTAQPLHGVSGVIRRTAYRRFGEGKNVRWLLLVLGDRVEAVGAHLRSLATLRPDNPITQTGVLSEVRRHPVRSRRGHGRVDLRHAWLDPLIVAGPWLLGVGVVVSLLTRGRRHG